MRVWSEESSVGKFLASNGMLPVFNIAMSIMCGL
jgi:hypothetical protein